MAVFFGQALPNESFDHGLLIENISYEVCYYWCGQRGLAERAGKPARAVLLSVVRLLESLLHLAKVASLRN